MLISNSIGNILKEVRERSNLSQRELADMAYLSRQTISKYELDVSQISVEKFMVLLDIMGASVLLKDGKIKIMEVKNMKTFGYLRINIDGDIYSKYDGKWIAVDMKCGTY